jgi:hypothetical protein
MAAITISFPIIEKSIRHINSPDAGGNTEQSFMGPSAGFPLGSAAQIRLCGSYLASVYMLTCFLNLTGSLRHSLHFKVLLFKGESID